MIYGFQPLTIFAKGSILDVWLDSKYFSSENMLSFKLMETGVHGQSLVNVIVRVGVAIVHESENATHLILVTEEQNAQDPIKNLSFTAIHFHVQVIFLHFSFCFFTLAQNIFLHLFHI